MLQSENNKFKNVLCEQPAPEAPPVRKAQPKKKKTKTHSPSKVGKTIRNVFDGSILVKDGVLKLLPFIFFLTFIIICYIANSYYSEKTIKNIEKVRKEIKELEMEYIATKSDLMICSKQSAVAERLDTLHSGILESVVPPKKIFVKQDTAKSVKK